MSEIASEEESQEQIIDVFATDSQTSDESDDTGRSEVEETPDSLIPYSFAKKHNILVELNEIGEAIVSFSETPKLSILAEVKRRLDTKLSLNKLSLSDFETQLRTVYDTGGSQANQLMDNMGEDLDLERLAEEMPQTTDLLEADDDAPIIRLINALLTQAIRESASDIHLEAFEAVSYTHLTLPTIYSV